MWQNSSSETDQWCSIILENGLSVSKVPKQPIILLLLTRTVTEMSIRLHLCWNRDRLPDSPSLFNSENMTRDDSTQTHFPTEQRWMFIWLKWLRKYQIREWIWVKITTWCSTERRWGEEKDKPAYQAAIADVQDKQISIHPCVVMLGEVVVVVLYSHRCHASVEKNQKHVKLQLWFGIEVKKRSVF